MGPWPMEQVVSGPGCRGYRRPHRLEAGSLYRSLYRSPYLGQNTKELSPDHDASSRRLYSIEVSIDILLCTRFVAWNYCAAPGLAFTGGFTCKEIN
jgi:hypothetical protein